MPSSQEPAGRDADIAAAGFYADALRPFGTARVLPPAAFRSLAFWQLEDLAVWSRDWVCVGTHHDIPAVGDLLPFTVGTHGLHVQRTATGVVARFNLAQHGGCRVVPVQCQTGTKTRCSFTSCGYSRDRGAIAAGDLGDGTPEMHQYLGLRPERLLTVAVKSWGPLIFVSLDVEPADLAEVAARLGRTFFDNARGARVSTWSVEHKANWKLLAQALVGELAEADQGRHWVAGRSRAGDGEFVEAAWLFPNLVLLADEAETCVIAMQSTAIGQTLCRLTVFGREAEQGSAPARWSARIAPLARRAEDEQEAAVRWGTTSRPDTVGAALPLQEHAQGWWMQQVLARKVLDVPAVNLDLQRYQRAAG